MVSDWVVKVPAWISAFAAIGLLAGVGFTSWFAFKAFHKQSEAVAILQNQAEEQRKLNERQIEVLSLQADELRESLAQRKLDAAERRQH